MRCFTFTGQKGRQTKHKALPSSPSDGCMLGTPDTWALSSAGRVQLGAAPGARDLPHQARRWGQK